MRAKEGNFGKVGDAQIIFKPRTRLRSDRGWLSAVDGICFR
jgi:hypothetical protein